MIPIKEGARHGNDMTGDGRNAAVAAVGYRSSITSEPAGCQPALDDLIADTRVWLNFHMAEASRNAILADGYRQRLRSLLATAERGHNGTQR